MDSSTIPICETLENRFPDCLHMSLELTPCNSDENKPLRKIINSLLEKSPSEVDLYLEIYFNDQWEELKFGRVKFGLKGGELRLEIDGGEMPHKLREFLKPLKPFIHKEQTRDIKNETATTADLATDSVKLGSSVKQISGRREKYESIAYQVTTKGPKELPVWEFIAKAEPRLSGGWKREKLGKLLITEQVCKIEAKFIVSRCDIHLIAGEGLYPKNLSKNKRAWIEHELAEWFLTSKIQGCLSYQYLYFPTIDKRE